MASGAAVAPPGGQESEKLVTRVCRVVTNGGDSTETAEAVDDLVRWQLGLDDFPGTIDKPLQSLSLCRSAAGVLC